MSDTPSRLEQMLRAAITSTVQRVALDSLSTAPSVVLLQLARKLGQFLVPAPSKETRLVILWRGRASAIGVEWRSRKSAPIVLAMQDISLMAASLAEPPKDKEMYEPISLSWWGANRHAVRISLSATAAEDALEIWQAGIPDGPDERWTWFVRYISGLTELHHTVRGLLVSRIGMARKHLDVQVQALRNGRVLPLHKRLADALDLLPRLVEIGAADLIDDVLTSLMLCVFGTGWRVRAVRRDPPVADEENPGGLLERLLRQVRSYADTTGSSVSSRLVGLVDCLDAGMSASLPSFPRFEGPEDDMLSLLAMWTRVHGLSRRLLRSRPAALEREAGLAWISVTEKTVPLLVAKLAKPLEDRSPHEQARNWLVVWFCLEILNEECAHETRDIDARYEVRAELAYTLREALRYDLFGDRVDYFHDASTLASALAHLVSYHATRVVGIPPAYQVDRLMNLIGGEGGANRYPAVEHLQHVANIYIAGHFLLSLRVNRGDTVATAGELFAGNAAPDVVQKYRRAFSLAAMFHDVGHILLPSDARLSQALLLDDANVRTVLQSRNEASAVQAAALTTHCLEQLGLDLGRKPIDTPPVQPLVYFEKPEVEHLAAFFNRQAQGGHASHGLLGAWYLHRVGAYAAKMRHEDDTLRECRMWALRAILLHDVVTREIDTDKDPVAALLVMCNEVFEWSPSHHAGTRPHTLGRPPRGPGPSPSMYRVERSIEIHHITQTARSGSSATQFDAVLSAPSGTWPEIVVELMPPEYLDGPVLRVWLAKAQAMGRIKPGSKSGFGPILLIRSALDPDLLHCKLDTRQALKRALKEHTLLPELIEWCEVTERFSSKAWTEQVRLGYLKKQIYDGDIQDRIPEIEKTVAEYLERLERELREAG
jgi:hypothetical protein